MSERAASGEARPWATPAGVRLCRLGELADRTARGFDFEMRARRFHGFVVRRGNSVRGYIDRCPHAGLPLARRLDAHLVADGQLSPAQGTAPCSRSRPGTASAVPCAGQSLGGWPVGVVEGWIVTC